MFTQQLVGVMPSEVYITACLLLVLELHIPDTCDKDDVLLCVLCKVSRSPARESECVDVGSCSAVVITRV